MWQTAGALTPRPIARTCAGIAKLGEGAVCLGDQADQGLRILRVAVGIVQQQNFEPRPAQPRAGCRAANAGYRRG